MDAARLEEIKTALEAQLAREKQEDLLMRFGATLSVYLERRGHKSAGDAAIRLVLRTCIGFRAAPRDLKERAERQTLVIALRNAGVSLRWIAVLLNCDEAAVRRLLKWTPPRGITRPSGGEPVGGVGAVANATGKFRSWLAGVGKTDRAGARLLAALGAMTVGEMELYQACDSVRCRPEDVSGPSRVRAVVDQRRQVARTLFAQGRNLSEIGRMLNRSREAVRKLLGRGKDAG